MCVVDCEIENKNKMKVKVSVGVGALRVRRERGAKYLITVQVIQWKYEMN